MPSKLQYLHWRHQLKMHHVIQRYLNRLPEQYNRNRKTVMITFQPNLKNEIPGAGSRPKRAHGCKLKVDDYALTLSGCLGIYLIMHMNEVTG